MERRRLWRPRASAGTERVARPPPAARGGNGKRDGPTDRPADLLRACPSPPVFQRVPRLRGVPPPPPACGGGGGGAPPLEPGGPRSPPRPTPPPLLLRCRARLTPAARTGKRRPRLRSVRSRSVESAAATGARPSGPAEAAAEGSVRRQRRPRECEAARSGRAEPGWGHDPRLPCLGRAASLSARGRQELGAGCRGPRGAGFSDSFILRRREPEAAGAARRGGKRGRPRAGLHCARRGPGSRGRWARAPCAAPRRPLRPQLAASLEMAPLMFLGRTNRSFLAFSACSPPPLSSES